MKKTTYIFLLFLLLAGCSFDKLTTQNKIVDPNSYKTNVVFDKEKSDYALQTLKKSIQTSSKDKMLLVKEETDNIGFTHFKYQQYYDEIKVQGGEYIIHKKGEYISSISGNFYDNLNINTIPTISEEQAFDYAIREIPASQYAWEAKNEKRPKGEIIIAPLKGNFEKDNFRLCWKFDVSTSKPKITSFSVFIDANNGQVVNKISLINNEDATGVAYTLYNSNPVNITTDYYWDWIGYEYRLQETARPIRTYDSGFLFEIALASDYEDDDNYWNYSGDDNTLAACQVHWGIEKIYDFYYSEFNRNSYDNLGSLIKSYVDYDYSVLPFNDNINASWLGDEQVMVYGSGGYDNQGQFVDYVVGLDIVGHEFTHAVTQFTAGLIYQNESGALNESFSDIIGTCIEFNTYSDANWLIAEDIYGFSDYFRSMQNPNLKNHPDTYNGTYWYAGANDNGGVHTNSGVQNYWFYLLSEGGNGNNDLGNNYNVSGVGIEKAAQIAYRALAYYLTSNSNYYSSYAATMHAAIDLYGEGSNEYLATKNAWYAVGIGEPQECTATNTLTAQSGNFADNSGTGNYQNFTYCKWLIQPPGATSITLNFTAFNTELNYDFVKVYKGATVNSPLLGSFSGSSIPNTITANTDKLLVVFSSDELEVAQGWSATYFTNLSTGVSVAEQENSIKIFPNPFSQNLIVQSEKYNLEKLTLFDIVGKKVFEKSSENSHQIELNLVFIPKGVYLIQLTDKLGNIVKQQKITKQ